MKRIELGIILLILCGSDLVAQNFISVVDTNIQYYGRWDFSDPSAPTHSWPGVYIYAEFEGTSVGIQTDDNACWYNIFIDSVFVKVFHGTTEGGTAYTLASGLPDGRHTILITKRGETSWTKFSFNGFILDEGKNLLLPTEKPAKRIEFIGDSYTSASGNEWTKASKAPSDTLTNIYKGFGPVIARYYNAQYQMTSRGGIGLVLDWQGDYSNNMPSVFDRTLYYTASPKWDFSKWVPNLVVVCLGLNDYSGWNGYYSTISQDLAALYRTKYHDFIATIMGEYPGANILAVAANGIDWLKTNISQVVAEENAMGHSNVHYAFFPYYNNGYVNEGHPTVAIHQKIADTLIYAIDTINVWQPYHGTVLPHITQAPVSPFTVYDTSYVLSIKTDSYTTMRFSTEDKPYNQMENTFTTTGKLNHSATLSCTHGIQYFYYLRGIDIYGNAMDTSTVVQFSVDTSKSITRWISSTYDHSSWKTGQAPLGFADAGLLTTRTDSVSTTYYWNTFNISGFTNLKSCTLRVKGNSGAVIYLNGSEYKRIQMPSESIVYNTLALQSSQFDQTFILSRVGLYVLHEGINSIAVEVHTANSSNINTSFDASLQNGNGIFYFPLDSTWSYYDSGSEPPDQLVEKSTDIKMAESTLIPGKTVLYSNYPNPFNPTTTIRYEIPAKSHVSMKIFDLLGREIVTLVDEMKQAGMFSVQFNAGTLSSGMYFCRLQAGHTVAVTKLMLIK